MKAIIMHRGGEPHEVLEYVDRPDPVPGAGEVLVEVAAAGVNFMDTMVRRGGTWQHMPDPKIIGVEGAGRIAALGEGVADFKVGDRVAWVYVPGSYAERIVAPAGLLVPVPDAIDDRTAAAAMMQGLTASHFATDYYPVQPGDVALVHAAAGGVGQILTQIIKRRGGTVIGRVSSEAKTPVARAAGADHVIVDREGKFADAVMELTKGEGVHVVYDGSGAATFQGSLASLRRSGTLAFYGPGMGVPEPFSITSLPKSVKVGYPTFYDHIPTPDLLRKRTAQLFDWIADGMLKIDIGATYPLSETAQAHADIESRKTTGKLLLLP